MQRSNKSAVIAHFLQIYFGMDQAQVEVVLEEGEWAALGELHPQEAQRDWRVGPFPSEAAAAEAAQQQRRKLDLSLAKPADEEEDLHRCSLAEFVAMPQHRANGGSGGSDGGQEDDSRADVAFALPAGASEPAPAAVVPAASAGTEAALGTGAEAEAEAAEAAGCRDPPCFWQVWS